MKTIRLHEEPETSTAKLLNAALEETAQRNISLALTRIHDAYYSKSRDERIRWLKQARDDINGALVAMGEK